MAISSELIGTLGGGGELTQSYFWFNGSNREFSQLDKSWNVPRGNYLLAWQGVLNNIFASGSQQIFVNGVSIYELRNPGITTAAIGGFVLLEDVDTITLTGEGAKRFAEDPEVAFAKVK